MINIIIQEIREEIEERKISVSEMARNLNLRQQTLDKILRGERGMGSRVFARVMEARPHWWPLLNGSAPVDSGNNRGPDGPDSAISEP